MTRRETPRILPPCGSAHASRGAPASPRCFSDGPASRPTHRTEAGAPTRIKTKPTSNPKPDTNPQTQPPIQPKPPNPVGAAASPRCFSDGPASRQPIAPRPVLPPESKSNPHQTQSQTPTHKPGRPSSIQPPNPVGAAAPPRCPSAKPAPRQPIAPRPVLPPESKPNPHQTQSQTPIHKPGRPSSIQPPNPVGAAAPPRCFSDGPASRQPIAPRPVLPPESKPNPHQTQSQTPTHKPSRPSSLQPPNPVGAAAPPRCFSDGPASRQPVAPRSVLPPESKSNPHQTQSQTPIHKPSRPSSLNRRTQWERRPRRDALDLTPRTNSPLHPAPHHASAPACNAAYAG